MPEKTDGYTIGVEEEYQVIDPKTRGLDACARRVLERARQALGDEEVAPELRASQIEVMSPVCRSFAEVRAELVRLRGAIMQAAEEEGLRIAARHHPDHDLLSRPAETIHLWYLRRHGERLTWHR